jgi:hypothetical protein
MGRIGRVFKRMPATIDRPQWGGGGTKLAHMRYI